MPSTIKSGFFESILTDSYGSPPAGILPIDSLVLYSGVQPGTPLNSQGILAYSSIVPISAVNWTFPSAGVIQLEPIDITNDFQTVSDQVSFIRIFRQSLGVIDIPVSLSGGTGDAVVSSLTAGVGGTITISNIKFKINTAGNVCVNTPVANFILSKLVGIALPYDTLNAASRYKLPISGGAEYTENVTVSVYSGPVPSDADELPSGVLLWQTNITGNNLFTVNGNSQGLSSTLSSTAIASGIPSFLRISKPSYTTIAGATVPACKFQTTIGSATATFMSASEFLISNTYQLNNLTVLMSAD